ncbi:hypothetical protein PENSPDRAFT_597305 [Peniophora sp. CONT]|nr:hypothetical protein PENSPDRAFT_597305 [Peniophora sp. CONT]
MSGTRAAFQGPKRKLVIAFDLGTTFSGVSYAVLDPGKVPDIKTVNRWPGQEAGDNKIQTVVYYDTNGKLLAVGAEQPPELDGGDFDEDEDDDWDAVEPYKVEWFKLLLRSATPAATNADIPRTVLPPQKNIEGVYTDFYKYMFDHTQRYIKETHATGALLWDSLEGDIEFILTHPNGWEGPQQSIMRRAAIQAGLVPNTLGGHDRIKFVSEGEASFHFCVSSGMLEEAIETGTNIMIIDAGGGTVDFSTYSFENAAPIEIAELAAPAGIYQGSALVSQRARNMLTEKLAGNKFGDKAYLDAMTAEFDKTTKKRFKGSGDSYVRFSSMANDKDTKLGIRNGQIKLTNAEIASWFDPAVREIIATIEDQQQASGNEIPIYLLVGGFAANEYLFAKLKLYLEAAGLQLYRPDANTNKAVAEGAVSFHIDHYISARIAKLTYGSRCAHVYDRKQADHAQRANKIFVSPDGLEMLNDGFQAVLLKGTQVTEETEFERPFHIVSRFGVDRIDCEVTCYRGDRSPKWTDEEPELFSTLCTITADASRIPKSTQRGARGDYCRQDYTVVLSFGLTELKAHLCWMEKGVKRTGPAHVVYDDDFAVTVPQ